MNMQLKPATPAGGSGGNLNRNILSLNNQPVNGNKQKNTSIASDSGVNNPTLKNMDEKAVAATGQKDVSIKNKETITQENTTTNGHLQKNDAKSSTKTESVQLATPKPVAAPLSNPVEDTAKKEEKKENQDKETKKEEKKNDDSAKSSTGNKFPEKISKEPLEKLKKNEEKPAKSSIGSKAPEKIAKEILEKVKKNEEKTAKSSTGSKAPEKISKESPRKTDPKVRQSPRSLDKKDNKTKDNSEVIDLTETENPEKDLLIDAELPVGKPEATSTPGKVLKYRLGQLQSKQNFDDTSAGVETPKTDGNKTESVENKKIVDENITTVTTTLNIDSSLPITRPTGRISGRRSFRDTSNYSFENRYTGTYRQISEDDRYNSSMNVTVGSDLTATNLSTDSRNQTSSSWFSFGSRGKKRERTPPQSNVTVATSECLDSELSPKRPRVDVSGFFSLIKSPVVSLCNKFSRTKSSSTPNGRKDGVEDENDKSIIEEELDILDVIENVSRNEEHNDVIVDEKTKNITEAVDALNDSDLDKDKDTLKNDDLAEDIIVKETLLETNKKVCNIM